MRQIIRWLVNDLQRFGYKFKKGEKKNIRIILFWIYSRIIQLFIKLINSLWALPFVISMRLLKRFILIRVGSFTSHRIGHFISDPLFEIAKIREVHKLKSVDLWAVGKNISNFAWYSYIKNYFTISRLFIHVYTWNKIIPGGKHHEIPTFIMQQSRDLDGLFYKSSLRINLSKKVETDARLSLGRIGWKNDEPFICLLSRDSEYLKNIAPHDGNKLIDDKFYDYHSYRNSTIENYTKGVEFLLDRGFWVFRMGNLTERELRISHPRFLDYSKSDIKSDQLDIWMFSNCSACISTGTGIDFLSWIQGIPSLVLNDIPIFACQTSLPIKSVPKRLFWGVSNKELTLDEYLSAFFYKSDQYRKNGISVKELGESEILHEIKDFYSERLNKAVKSNCMSQAQLEFFKKLKSQPSFASFHGFINPDFRISERWLNNLE